MACEPSHLEATVMHGKMRLCLAAVAVGLATTATLSLAQFLPILGIRSASASTGAGVKGPAGFDINAGDDSSGDGRHRPSGSNTNGTGVKTPGFTEGCIGPAPTNPDNWNPECKPPDSKGPSSWALAQRANNLLAVPKPMVRTAPPRGKRVLVGIPTWFWLDRSQWASRSATAKAGGVSATVTASAYQIVIDAGDGSDPFTCGAPWTPYADGATSDCVHAYTHSGSYTVRVTANWGADWTGSDGNGGTLPTVGRTVRFSVQVVQARSELIANP